MRTRRQLFSLALGGALMSGAVAAAPIATADPMPGFSFDSAELQRRMDSCMEYQIGPNEILMGWLNVRTTGRETELKSWSTMRQVTSSRSTPP